MKKRRVGRTLSRSSKQKRALLRSLLVGLISTRRIETTLAKAKELRPFAEKMVTRAKKATDDLKKVTAIRLLKKDLPEKSAKKLIEIAKTFSDRKGGYTRIVKLPFRKSDSSERAIIEWVGEAGSTSSRKSGTSKSANAQDDKKKSKKEKKEEEKAKDDKK